jgi:hypothetical protein
MPDQIICASRVRSRAAQNLAPEKGRHATATEAKNAARVAASASVRVGVNCIALAQSIQADAVRTHPLAAWVIVRDQVDYPGDLVARLVTDGLTPYVLLADSLAGLHAQLPPGLTRTGRQPSDPPELIEVWVSAPV